MRRVIYEHRMSWGSDWDEFTVVYSMCSNWSDVHECGRRDFIGPSPIIHVLATRPSEEKLFAREITGVRALIRMSGAELITYDSDDDTEEEE